MILVELLEELSKKFKKKLDQIKINKLKNKLQ